MLGKVMDSSALRDGVMHENYMVPTEPATPEYVLAVLQDQHRQECACGDSDPDLKLSFATTIAEWRDACDLTGWKQLGRSCGLMFGIELPDAAWKQALEPARERRLQDVCRLIARHAERPVIEPVALLGRSCAPVGAFLAIRSLLAQAGVGVDEMRPSTPLGPYARRHLQVFVGPIARLAPGALPPVRIRTWFCEIALIGLLAAVPLLALGALGGVAAICGLLLFGVQAVAWIAGLAKPKSVVFGDLCTFKDLSVLIAGHHAIYHRCDRR